MKKADVTQKEVNDAYTALSKARGELSEVHKGLWTKWDKMRELNLVKMANIIFHILVRH